MHRLQTLLGTRALASVLALGELVATTATASADVACNSYGECWHVGHRCTYRPSWAFTFTATNGADHISTTGAFTE